MGMTESVLCKVVWQNYRDESLMNGIKDRRIRMTGRRELSYLSGFLKRCKK